MRPRNWRPQVTPSSPRPPRGSPPPGSPPSTRHSPTWPPTSALPARPEPASSPGIRRSFAPGGSGIDRGSISLHLRRPLARAATRRLRAQPSARTTSTSSRSWSTPSGRCVSARQARPATTARTPGRRRGRGRAADGRRDRPGESGAVHPGPFDDALYAPGISPMHDAARARADYRHSWCAEMVGPFVSGAAGLSELNELAPDRTWSRACPLDHGRWGS
jgi:hypothetical protein